MRRGRYETVIGSGSAFSHAALERYPFVMRWDVARHPLPRRPVRAPARARGVVLGTEAPPWLATGPAELPFDFCGHVQRLCGDIVARCPELNHIDPSKLLFCMTQARTGRVHGLQARVTPLRFRDGGLRRRRHGIPYQVQRYILDGREMLYLVTFCLPRLLDQEFDGKFVTLRVPYPMGFHAKGLDGRIDDPDGGWKGRGLWSTYAGRDPDHIEGGKGTTSKVVHFQLRPDPLAR